MKSKRRNYKFAILHNGSSLPTLQKKKKGTRRWLFNNSRNISRFDLTSHFRSGHDFPRNQLKIIFAVTDLKLCCQYYFIKYNCRSENNFVHNRQQMVVTICIQCFINQNSFTVGSTYKSCQQCCMSVCRDWYFFQTLSPPCGNRAKAMLMYTLFVFTGIYMIQ